MNKFLIYGSYGYTGQLIVAQALEQGLRPILAGRDQKKLAEQARTSGLESRLFDLSDTQTLEAALQEVDVVLHCAGPFVHTFRPMVAACLRTKTHYVDISGEIPGFEATAALDLQAQQAGITLMPGCGFDVVPSDCLAAHLKTRLPDATHLKLYIRSVGGGVSRGTARSGIENMHRQGTIRRNGKIATVPPAWRTPLVDFGRGPVPLVSIGWGDVSTAYYSTGIPNIETYMAFPPKAIKMMKISRYFGWLLYLKPVKRLLQWMLRFIPPGPSLEQRTHGFALILGEAANEQQRVQTLLRVKEGYALTALTSLESVKRIMAGDFKSGFQTPSMAWGAAYILEFPGTERTDL